LRRWLPWAAVVLMLLYLLTGLRLIQPNERAVVRRFGRVLDEKPRPGLFVGLPWGMDRVDRVQVDRVQTATFGFRGVDDEHASAGTPQGQYLTGDRNLINITAVINYTVDDDDGQSYLALEDYLEQLPVSQTVLERLGESVLAEVVAGRRVEDVLLPVAERSSIQDRCQSELSSRIRGYRLGVKIQSVNIVLREVPAEVKAAFDDVTRAIQRRETLRLEAKRYESVTKSAADAEADRLRQDAEVAYADQIKKANVDRASFELHLKNAPKPGKERDDYLQHIWWQEVGSALMEMAKQRRIQDVDPFVTKNGLEIVLPMSMRPGK
jgi:modulator of FtsH protease HflK